jgi:hypothetical protein
MMKNRRPDALASLHEKLSVAGISPKTPQPRAGIEWHMP